MSGAPLPLWARRPDDDYRVVQHSPVDVVWENAAGERLLQTDEDNFEAVPVVERTVPHDRDTPAPTPAPVTQVVHNGVSAAFVVACSAGGAAVAVVIAHLLR